MKRMFFMSAMAAGVLAFAGCSNDLDNIAPGENDALGFGEDVIEIGLTNNNADTRAARPIGSSAAANDVDHVKLVVYQVTGTAGSYTYKKITTVTIKDEPTNIIEWTYGPTGEGPSTTDRPEGTSVTMTGLEPNTSYEFVAYGFNNEAGTAPTFVTEPDANDIPSADHSSAAIEEIFAGTSNIVTTNKDGKFSKDVEITMERQIAGLLGYFTNIPTKAGEDKIVKKLVVYANKKSSGYNFSYAESALNGTNCVDPEEDEYGHALLTFDMEKIATNYVADAASQTAESYEFATVTNASEETVASKSAPFAEEYKAAAGLTLKAGSCFGACFVLPYDKHYAANTLTVVLEDANGTPLKTMTVYTDKVPTDANNNAKQFDIRKNNFYSIGKKLYTDNNEGKEDEEDDPDPDDPIDVNATTEIKLLLNDSWDVLHNMGISGD